MNPYRAAVAASGLILASLLAGCSHTAKADSTADLRATAIKKCETAVKAQLKSPGSAKFSDVKDAPHAGEEPDTNTSYRSFEISGNVDSQNGYGALLRSTWTCQIGYNMKSKAWSTVAANVDEG